MYKDTALEINEEGSHNGEFVEECYFFASDLDPAGINGEWSKYFYYTDSYQDASIRLIDQHNRVKNPGIKSSIDLVEDSTLLSNEHKYVIFVREGFGHFLINTLCVMFSIYEEDKEASFVFLTGTDEFDKFNTNKVLAFLTEVCDAYKIPHCILNSNKVSYSLDGHELQTDYLIYRAKNITLVNGDLTTKDFSLKDIKTYIDKYIVQLFGGYQAPTRRIYITRNNYNSNPEPYYLDKDFGIVGYKSVWDRIYDENLVEKHLASYGFESVQVESMNSIKDQIKLMMSTAVLVSPSGTGLTNCLFMPDNGLMVELRVEIGSRGGSHRLTKEYFDFSAAKQHMYLAIDVQDKQGTTAVKKLDRFFKLFDIEKL